MGTEVQTSDSPVVDPIVNTKYEACKAFTMQGKEYKRGDVVDTSVVNQFKIGQLLNQRFLRPVAPVTPPQPNPE